MPTLTQASLSPVERRVVEGLVRVLQAEFGSHLRGVWLYGSRARGEKPHEESDVDLIVVSDRAAERDERLVLELADRAALEEGASPVFFSVRLYTPELVAQRREIRSFFFQEVDRDKIVLAGEP